jgi:Flp pilus assembly CpaF family ATPase
MLDNQHTINEILGTSLESLRIYFDDPGITEVMVTGDGRVWLERHGEMVRTETIMSEDNRVVALKAISKTVKRDLKEGTPHAVVSTSIGDLRFAGAVGVEVNGTTLCIRKHMPAEERPSLEQLVERKMLSEDQANHLINFIQKKKTLVFAGVTGSGKTTLLNALAKKIPPFERVGLIEDAREIAIENENKDCYLSNAQAGITSRLLVQHALRSRYDRLILGETRGEDTFDLIRGLSAGHPGLTTLHANSAKDALYALEMMFQMSLPAGADIPIQVTRRYISRAIHCVIYAERWYEIGKNGEPYSKRAVTEIKSVTGVDANGDYVLE